MEELLNKEVVMKYITLYDTETYLYNMVGANAKKRGFLIFEEFFDICMWKSSRPKRRYVQNKLIIEEITRKSFIESDEVQKMEILGQLNGVGIPTASAILSVVFPEKYPVIDIRCLEQLNNLGYSISAYVTIKTWIKYIDIMRKLAASLQITPRQLDMALFAMHRNNLKQEGYDNLYSKRTRNN